MCTPSLAIDAIIQVSSHKNEEPAILLVLRSDTSEELYAIPGGFVNVGESVETATIREVKEETNADIIYLEQFRTYSDPSRDKRRHTVSVVFICTGDASNLKRGDDAKEVVIVPLSELPGKKFAFDHEVILKDYVKKYHPKYEFI
jgi:8-oxo-dGTP diphosphatase